MSKKSLVLNLILGYSIECAAGMAEWQTRKTKDLVIAFRSWKFESSCPHFLMELWLHFFVYLIINEQNCYVSLLLLF